MKVLIGLRNAFMVLGMILLLILVAAGVASMPDLRRYLQVRQM